MIGNTEGLQNVKKLVHTKTGRLDLALSENISKSLQSSAKKNKIYLLSVKHGGGNVVTWVCVLTSGTRQLVFNDDVTADKSNRMYCKI